MLTYYDIFLAISSVLAFYALFFYLINSTRKYRISKSNYYLDRVKFTELKIVPIKELIKNFENTKKSAMINRITKAYIGRDFDDDVKDDYLNILNELRIICEGCLIDVFDSDYVRANLESVIRIYLENSTKFSIVNNTEDYAPIELMLDEWRSRKKFYNKKRNVL